MLCVDDDPPVLGAIARRLGPGFAIETATYLDEARRRLWRGGRCDAIILDLNLGGARGEDLLADVHMLRHIPRVVVFSGAIETRRAGTLVRRCYRVLDKGPMDELLAAVARAAAAEPEPDRLGAFANAWGLAEGEEDVVRLTAAGHSEDAVAELLDCERTTVQTHLARARQKTGCADRRQLGALLLEHLGWRAHGEACAG